LCGWLGWRRGRTKGGGEVYWIITQLDTKGVVIVCKTQAYHTVKNDANPHYIPNLLHKTVRSSPPSFHSINLEV
jgi:hypothetical protein